MSPYGTDVIMFHARNPCGRLGRGSWGKEYTSPTSSPPFPSHHMCLLEGMIYTSFALRRIWRNTMLTTQHWKGQGNYWGSEGGGAALCDWHPVRSRRIFPLGITFDEANFDYVGIAIIRHNYYYCERMGNTSLGKASVADTWLVHAGSKCSPKDHFHSNLIFSWSFFDYQSWNIKYRLEPERCWKLKFIGGARLCPWEITLNVVQMLQQQGRKVPSCKQATTEESRECLAFHQPSVWFICTTLI